MGEVERDSQLGVDMLQELHGQHPMVPSSCSGPCRRGQLGSPPHRRYGELEDDGSDDLKKVTCDGLSLSASVCIR